MNWICWVAVGWLGFNAILILYAVIYAYRRNKEDERAKP